jgi:hypothetical protein
MDFLDNNRQEEGFEELAKELEDLVSYIHKPGLGRLLDGIPCLRFQGGTSVRTSCLSDKSPKTTVI